MVCGECRGLKGCGLVVLKSKRQRSVYVDVRWVEVREHALALWKLEDIQENNIGEEGVAWLALSVVRLSETLFSSML